MRHEAEEGLETLETTLGKLDMVQTLAHTQTHTHRPPGTRTRAPATRSVVDLVMADMGGLGPARMTAPSEMLHTTSARSVCDDDCMAPCISRPSPKDPKTLLPSSIV